MSRRSLTVTVTWTLFKVKYCQLLWELNAVVWTHGQTTQSIQFMIMYAWICSKYQIIFMCNLCTRHLASVALCAGGAAGTIELSCCRLTSFPHLDKTRGRGPVKWKGLFVFRYHINFGRRQTPQSNAHSTVSPWGMWGWGVLTKDLESWHSITLT